MKQNTNAKKLKMSFSKRTLAAVIAVMSCLSFTAAPISDSKSVPSVFSGVTVNAAMVSTKVPTNIPSEIIAFSCFGNMGITPNAWNKSKNGQYFLVFSKSEGNLVLYHNTRRGRKPVWWSSGKRTSNGECILQKDGNLVIYETVDGERSVCWHSGTYRDGWTSLVLDDNGNLYIYSPYAQSTNVLHYGTAWPLPGREYIREKRKEYLEVSSNTKMEVRPIAKGIVEYVGYDYLTIKHPLLGVTSTYGPFKEKGNLNKKYHVSQQIDYNTVLGNPAGDSFRISIQDSHTGEFIDPYEYLTIPERVVG